MKVRMLIVLIVFTMSICTPFKINVHFNPGDKTASLLTLDVCHASGTAISGQADIPCVLAYPSSLSFFENSFMRQAANSVFIAFLIAFQQDRPPKA